MIDTRPSSTGFRDQPVSVPPLNAVPVTELLARMRTGDREAAASFLVNYGDLIRRRIRGKLGASVRRMFDSMDILSTIGRRFDRYVRDGKLQAVDEPQLWALLFRMAEAAVIDKVRIVKRLQIAEGEDGAIARELLARIQAAENNAEDGAEILLEKALAALRSDDDRTVLTLWLADWPLFRIAEAMGISPAAARQRWHSIRALLKQKLEAGEL